MNSLCGPVKGASPVPPGHESVVLASGEFTRNYNAKTFYRLSRSISRARGTPESNISASAGRAARAKKASAVNDHTEVASVVKPVGLSSRVAGSSFMVSRKTRDAPAMIPGRAEGSVTEVNAPRGDLPRLRAASSIRGFNWRSGCPYVTQCR